MKRTTILADDELMLEARYLAQHEGRTFTALVQDALREYVQTHRPPRRISFAGIGQSGRSWTPEQLDAELIAGLDRYEGWSPPRRRRPEEEGDLSDTGD
jgi:Bacterial antitoxin of type II TA system, VapB